MRKVKNRLISLLLTTVFAVGTMTGMTPVYAAGPEEKNDSVSAGDASYAEGEAIVCCKIAAADAMPVDAAKKETEKELEDKSCVADAEALLVLEDVDETPGVIALVRSDHLTTTELIGELEQQENVLFAEPNYTYNLQSTDMTGYQWQENGTCGIGVDGWNTYNGNTPTPAVDTGKQVVAIIDTGVDYTHEDLKSVMWDEGEKYPDLVKMGGGKYGYNAVLYDIDGEPDDTTDPKDTYGHGTHCAGIVADAWNHSGVSGVTSGARIMAVKVFNDLGDLHTDAMIRAYEYVIAAKKAGVNVVATNNSYGGPVMGVSENLVLEEAGKLGIVCVFAAGNDNKDMNRANRSSAIRRRFDHVVVVGASDERGRRAEFSNYGERDVDVFAPGVNIWSTVPMGTGGPNLDSRVFVLDGKEYALDYGKRTKAEDELFGLNGDEVNISVIQAGDGKNVLHVEPKRKNGVIIFQTKKYKDLSACHGCLLRLWSAKETGISIEAKEASEYGEQELKTITAYLKPGLNEISIPYPDETYSDAGKKNVGLQFEMTSADDRVYGEIESVDIREIRFTDTMENYEAWNGTSMATPVVAGALAVLAKAFPEDSAEKRAARVTGSVLRTDGIRKLCASDGIFRLDKALAQETCPVPGKATIKGNEFTVEGYFFGDTEGKVKLGNTTCTVKSWSDTKVVAELPQDFHEGEYLVEITSGKGAGHRYLRLGTASNLAPRLPLPGSTFSGNGEYVVSDSALADNTDFYSGDAKALVGLNGYLYAVFATAKAETAIFRYDIKNAKWEKICTGNDYQPRGAVVWNGKILIHAANEPKNKSAIGIFDPEKAKITWTVYNAEAFEDGVSMVTNGKGVYLLGGKECLYGNSKNSMDYGSFREIDPVKMTVRKLEEDEVGPFGNQLCVTADSNGRIYFGKGRTIDFIENIEITGCVIDGDKVTRTMNIKGNELFKDISKEGSAACTMVATKTGLMMTGPFVVDVNEAVVTDTWLLSYDGKKVEKLPEVISYRPIANPVSVGYKGRYYVLGQTIGETTSYVFAYLEADVTEPAGGALPKNSWNKSGGKWYYYDQNGNAEKNAYRNGWYLTKSGAWDGKTRAKGWKRDKTGWWYSLGAGKYLRDCWQKIDGKWYYFDKSGYTAANQFVKGWWIGKNCICSYRYQSKWKKNSVGWWYGDASGWYAKNATYTIDGRAYSFDAKGYCLNP